MTQASLAKRSNGQTVSCEGSIAWLSTKTECGVEGPVGGFLSGGIAPCSETVSFFPLPKAAMFEVWRSTGAQHVSGVIKQCH
jgi:hypothetical protein